MTKWLITGSRDYWNKAKLNSTLNNMVDKEKDILIHGGASGADLIAEKWCKKNKVKSIVVRPIRTDTGSYFLHRNAEMIGMCDKVISFWNGSSRGTKFTMNYAEARGIPITVVTPEKSIE